MKTRARMAAMVGVALMVATGTADAASQWSAAAPSPVVRFEGAAAVVGDKLYAFGGFGPGLNAQTAVHVYAPAADHWTALAAMPRAVTHVQAAVIGSRVYLAGGFEGANPGVAIDVVQSYDTATNTWSTSAVPALPSARASAGFVALGTGLHYLGGLLADRCTDTTQHLVFDTVNPGAGWTSAAPLPETKNHFQAVVLNGRIYAIGGQRGHDCGLVGLRSAHVYDPGSNTWSPIADLPQERSHHEASLFVWNDRIVLGGGVDGAGAAYASVFAYDAPGNRWTRWPDLPAARRSPLYQRVGTSLIFGVGAGGADGATGMSDLWVDQVRGDAPQVLFIRGADRSGGFTEATTDPARTEQLADIDNVAGTGNHGWGELRATLEAQGFIATQVKETAENASGPSAGQAVDLAAAGLSNHTIVVFGSNNASYNTAHASLVEGYVRAGGAALFISDANFGSDWSDAPSSDQTFLARFGITVNQDNGTYALTRAGSDFLRPDHPILAGIETFDGEGVSPAFTGTVVADVQTAVVARAKTQTRVNAPPFGPQNLGALRDVTPADASLLIASAGSGRLAVHFDRNTFFNAGGVGSDITRLDNRSYAINLFNWLASGANGPPPLFADGFESL